MSVISLTQIDFGGPAKVIDPNGTIYFRDGLTLTPNPVYREVESSVGGGGDDTLVDLTWTLEGQPTDIWSSGYRGVLLPSGYTNWTVAGGRCCGTSNRSVSIIGADAKGITLTRACLDAPVELFCGLGEPIWGRARWTAYIGQGKAVTDTDAFYVENTTAWDQSDFPTGHQEALCTLAWGSVTGWDTVYAEHGFKLTHEFSTAPVKQGNITVDKRITKYRPMLSFTPQQPSTTQLLSAIGLQGSSAGIGSRRSANANDAVVTGSGISLTVKSAAVRTGKFVFDNQSSRHGEFALMPALTAPGTRLVLA